MIRPLRRRWIYFLVNHVYCGTHHFEKKRKLLKKIGYSIGEGTKIVGPIFNTGKLTIGNNCWIGKNFSVDGNGEVTIEDNVNIAPNVTISTGSHIIGDKNNRAGEGLTFSCSIKKGSWICTNVTICNGSNIGTGCVVAACSVVIKSCDDNSLIAGNPAVFKKKLP